MGDFTIGNMYDINKQLMMNEPVLGKKKIKELIAGMADHYTKASTVYQYYILLCRERTDYTVFNHVTGCSLIHKDNSFQEDLFECLTNRGTVLSIDLDADSFAYEIWIKIDNEAYVYYFFPYDEAVIEV